MKYGKDGLAQRTAVGPRGISIRGARGQSGAALLTAMIIVTLIATLASSMVWQQWRRVEVEDADRARVEARWVLGGALDWARAILSEDARKRPAGDPVDHLGGAWATPMPEVPLSTFLAADGGGVDADSDALLSSSIVDAQSRYDLSRLLATDGASLAAEVAILARLCQTVGVSPDVANVIANGLRSSAAHDPGAPLLPRRVGQLTWLGIDAETVTALTPYVELLPVAEPVNVNTASPEVLAALVQNLDVATAEQLVQAREHAPFMTVQSFLEQIPDVAVPPNRISVSTEFFEVHSRLKLRSRILEQRALVQRAADGRVSVLDIEWGSRSDPARP